MFLQFSNFIGLVASDVAARGLDVPNVDHVLHFNIPRTPEIFIHRSGRTARANKSGLVTMMIGVTVIDIVEEV